MSDTLAPRRPGVVTFVGVILYIQAAIAFVIGLSLVFDRERELLQELTGQDADFIQTTAIVELILAVLLFLVASAIMSGQKWARLAVVSYWIVTHLGGPFNWNAIIYAGFGIFVLWALYGNAESDEYFEGAM